MKSRNRTIEVKRKKSWVLESIKIEEVRRILQGRLRRNKQVRGNPEESDVLEARWK